MRKDMTEEEADALDEFLTHTTPNVPPNRRSFLAQKGNRLVALDDLSEDYLMTKAMASQKTPTEIIGDMVREKIAASV
ncbi:MAG: hypothetical protein Ta2B_12940 [Termitinemataceae bacterium]|nr:MAG: hypothetical protein Ta2B_12940 [Termitinemataceae bacterium]